MTFCEFTCLLNLMSQVHFIFFIITLSKELSSLLPTKVHNSQFIVHDRDS